MATATKEVDREAMPPPPPRSPDANRKAQNPTLNIVIRPASTYAAYTGVDGRAKAEEFVRRNQYKPFTAWPESEREAFLEALPNWSGGMATSLAVTMRRQAGLEGGHNRTSLLKSLTVKTTTTASTTAAASSEVIKPKVKSTPKPSHKETEKEDVSEGGGGADSVYSYKHRKNRKEAEALIRGCDYKPTKSCNRDELESFLRKYPHWNELALRTLAGTMIRARGQTQEAKRLTEDYTPKKQNKNNKRKDTTVGTRSWCTPSNVPSSSSSASTAASSSSVQSDEPSSKKQKSDNDTPIVAVGISSSSPPRPPSPPAPIMVPGAADAEVEAKEPIKESETKADHALTCLRSDHYGYVSPLVNLATVVAAQKPDRLTEIAPGITVLGHGDGSSSPTSYPVSPPSRASSPSAESTVSYSPTTSSTAESAVARAIAAASLNPVSTAAPPPPPPPSSLPSPQFVQPVDFDKVAESFAVYKEKLQAKIQTTHNKTKEVAEQNKTMVNKIQSLKADLRKTVGEVDVATSGFTYAMSERARLQEEMLKLKKELESFNIDSDSIDKLCG